MKDDLRIFHFEPITKISQLMPLAEFSVPANKIRLPAEAFHSAFKEYSASLLNKDKRPSVLARLQELVQAAAELPGKVRHKEQERGL